MKVIEDLAQSGIVIPHEVPLIVLSPQALISVNDGDYPPDRQAPRTPVPREGVFVCGEWSIVDIPTVVAIRYLKMEPDRGMKVTAYETRPDGSVGVGGTWEIDLSAGPDVWFSSGPTGVLREVLRIFTDGPYAVEPSSGGDYTVLNIA